VAGNLLAAPHSDSLKGEEGVYLLRGERVGDKELRLPDEEVVDRVLRGEVGLFGIDGFQADRAPDRRYRTSPLKGLFAHQKGGFYHDGRFPTLAAVVEHYDAFFGLGLSASDKADLVQFLKSI
jgi:cytochrome c peroxidase